MRMMHTHRLTHVIHTPHTILTAIFRQTAVSQSRLILYLHFPYLSILTGYAKTFHSSSDTISSGENLMRLYQRSYGCRSSCWVSPQLSSLSLHRHTSLYPISIIFMFGVSKPQQSAPVSRNLIFWSPYFLSVFRIKTAHPSEHTHFISVQLYFVLHLHWPSFTAIYQTIFYRTCTYFTFQLQQDSFPS